MATSKMLVQNSGGLATSNGQSILDIEPTELHQRVPVALGSAELVSDYDQKTQ